ncbi:hypothetical protein [Actinomyces sp. 2119]|uniref:hypothetical protein n=1 Tax=Actinomyces sp. 2119 TaxID=2321393 RepID=UPI0015FF8AB1|nr:hypothetical protein [Actinomyces sp. 2119]
MTAETTESPAPGRTHGSAQDQDGQDWVDHVLAAFSGRRADHVLAAWGLTSLLPGSTVHFVGTWKVPVIRLQGGPSRLAETAGNALVETTWDLERRALWSITTTVPPRSAANRMSTNAWKESVQRGALVAAGVLQGVDMSAAAGSPGKKADLPVRAADLTLLSGRSYTAKSVQDTWELLGARTAEQAHSRATTEIRRLLDGETTLAQAKPGLRFSANQPTPRLTSGSEECDVLPLVDLLAFCGQLLLQPRQHAVTGRPDRSEPEAANSSGKAFSWVLNPVPLDIEAVVAIHESPPENLSWPRWTSQIRSTEGSAKISFLTYSRPEPSSTRTTPTATQGADRA